jgi:hypothetical protein
VPSAQGSVNSVRTNEDVDVVVVVVVVVVVIASFLPAMDANALKIKDLIVLHGGK